MEMADRILAVVAHPDDEVLGCGGTLARLSREGDVYVLILGTGVASRDIPEAQKEAGVAMLKKQASDANRALGTREVFFKSFPDNKFDSVPLLELVKAVEAKINELKPRVVFTHHHGDLNIDHRRTFEAAVTATRPLGNCPVRKVLAFETLSSTEWNARTPANAFLPDTYYDIADTIGLKVKAMEFYKTEIRDYPHPRSSEGIRILAQKRGLECGLKFAEAFSLVRSIK
jgi:LmbE family N-acetylglucosaminyl deacetylase